jgi:hypothetical protein
MALSIAATTTRENASDDRTRPGASAAFAYKAFISYPSSTVCAWVGDITH